MYFEASICCANTITKAAYSLNTHTCLQEAVSDGLDMGGSFSPHKRLRVDPELGVFGSFSMSQTTEKDCTKPQNSGLDTLAAVVGLQNLAPAGPTDSPVTKEHNANSPREDLETEKQLVGQIKLIKYFQRQCIALQSKFQLLQQQQFALQEQYRAHFGRSIDFMSPLSTRAAPSLSRAGGSSSSK